jgi:asparagine synthase (glutamine-hydrolysing)
LDRLLDMPDARVWEFVDREGLKALLAGNSTAPWYGQLMTLPQTMAYFLQLEYWLEHYQISLV